MSTLDILDSCARAMFGKGADEMTGEECERLLERLQRIFESPRVLSAQDLKLLEESGMEM